MVMLNYTGYEMLCVGALIGNKIKYALELWKLYSNLWLQMPQPVIDTSASVCSCRFDWIIHNLIDFRSSAYTDMISIISKIYLDKILSLNRNGQLILIDLVLQKDTYLQYIHLIWMDTPIYWSGLWFNTSILSYQYRKSFCGDKAILQPSYLHNEIFYTGRTNIFILNQGQGFHEMIYVDPCDVSGIRSAGQTLIDSLMLDISTRWQREGGQVNQHAIKSGKVVY